MKKWKNHEDGCVDVSNEEVAIALGCIQRIPYGWTTPVWFEPGNKDLVNGHGGLPNFTGDINVIGAWLMRYGISFEINGYPSGGYSGVVKIPSGPNSFNLINATSKDPAMAVSKAFCKMRWGGLKNKSCNNCGGIHETHMCHEGEP